MPKRRPRHQKQSGPLASPAPVAPAPTTIAPATPTPDPPAPWPAEAFLYILVTNSALTLLFMERLCADYALHHVTPMPGPGHVVVRGGLPMAATVLVAWVGGLSSFVLRTKRSEWRAAQQRSLDWLKKALWDLAGAIVLAIIAVGLAVVLRPEFTPSGLWARVSGEPASVVGGVVVLAVLAASTVLVLFLALSQPAKYTLRAWAFPGVAIGLTLGLLIEINAVGTAPITGVPEYWQAHTQDAWLLFLVFWAFVQGVFWYTYYGLRAESDDPRRPYGRLSGHAALAGAAQGLTRRGTDAMACDDPRLRDPRAAHSLCPGLACEGDLGGRVRVHRGRRR
jgi:uncharacterized membrane-anchored protein